MKKIFFSGIITALLLAGFSSCEKTCEDPFAPNYTLNGACIDLTATLVGNYNGQLLDSIVGLHSATMNAVVLQITKADDSHVQVSSATSQFVSFSAAVSSSGNGYYLTVPAQTSNGLAVTGAGAYFGSAADGVFVTTGNQLSIYALAGTQYEGFTGTHQ
jgi:hypothetical protein